MGIPTKLIEFLNQNKVRYQIIHHPEAFTAQELAAIEHVKGKNHAKVVIAKSNGRLLMLVLPADHRVELDRLEQLAGGRAELATEADFKAQFADCAVGTMPPFGKLYGVETWLDASLSNGTIVFEAGTHTDAIKMDYADYTRLAEPRIEQFAVKYH